MKIEHLRLSRFRNLEDNDLSFHERGHLIIGDNGQGKTNLLEALHYLTVLRSFRSQQDRECIRFGEETFHLEGGWLEEDGGRGTLAVGCSRQRKKVSLAGREVPAVSEAFGQFKSVLLTPEDIGIVRQGPSERRRHLDVLLSIVSPLYLEKLKRYRKALASRNVLLRRTPFSEEQMEPWERQMAESGAWLITRRREWLEKLAPEYERLFERLSGGERGSLGYYNSLLARHCPEGQSADTELIASVFAERMKKRRPVERERGLTLSGPQTDEVLFAIEGQPLRNFGSQGQQRTAVICLKMSEAVLLGRELGVRPVLLLDDIFAELDLHRSLRLLEELVESHQSFITAPRKEAVFERLGHLPVKFIRRGSVLDG
ncbi:DNA replication and repair protein RecF [bacterium]|nr:DNA replication and repair protein RecF [bacterium]